jgi:hypothetical protein
MKTFSRLATQVGFFSFAAFLISATTSTAPAATVFANGSSVSGWTITESKGIALVVDSATSSTINLEKAATFSSAAEGLDITFTQTSASAASTIDFGNESITNISGTPFTSFEFLLMNPGGDVASFGSSFAPPSPFTTKTATSDTVTYTGGSLANFATTFFGTGTDDDLIIDATTDGIGTTFTFKELPGGGVTPPPPAVPLPATDWQAAGLLSALAAVAGVKRLLKRQAV